MSKSYSTKSVCIVDNGLFSELGTTLSKSFGKVFYNSPWVSGFPSSNQTELGEGFSEFDRVSNVWEIFDDVDLFVFPDIYQGPLQEHLVSMGKRVFGSRNADELENFRDDAKSHFKSLGIPQPTYEVVKGIDALRKCLKGKGSNKVWIKTNLTRGDMETFPSVGYELVKNKIDKIESDLGPKSKSMEFIVEDHLPDTLDIAIDTFCIDGKFPDNVAIGCEIKGEAYLGAVKKWKEIPSQLTSIYEDLSQTLKSYEYRCMLSLESRIQKDKIWLCDPCCRAGSPPFELQLNWIKNIPEIMWEGAGGVIVEPDYAGKYGFEIMIHSEWANDHPLKIDFPEKFKEKIKFRYSAQFPDGLWIMPQKGGPRVASVVTSGDDMEACFEEAKEIAGEVKGMQIETFSRAIPELRDNMKQMSEWGYKF